MKKIFLLSILLNIFIGCSNRHEVSMPDPISLTGTKRQVQYDSLFMISKVMVNNDKLIAFQDIAEGMFSVFELPSLKYLYSYGNKGGASYEYGNVDHSSITNSEYLTIFDNHRIKEVRFDNDKATLVKSESFIIDRNPINSLQKINDSLYYVENYSDQNPDKEYVFVNINNKNKIFFGEYPEWNKEITEQSSIATEYKKSSRYSPYNNKIAAFYYKYPSFKFFNLSGETESEFFIKGMPLRNTGKIYFAEPYLGEQYIYVMWVNAPKKEITNLDGKYMPQILIIDWDGNIKANYKLDRPILSFAVSEKYGKLYGPSFLETDVFYEYNLPDLGENENTRNDIELTHLNTDRFESLFFTGYKFAREDEINKIYKNRNVNYFIPSEKNTPGFQIDIRYDVNAEDYRPGGVVDSPEIEREEKAIYVKDKKVNVVSRHRTFRDQKGEEDDIYEKIFIFPVGSDCIIITMNSVNKGQQILEKYSNSMEKIIESFKVK